MNREILFRGKRRYDSKWIYGNLITINEKNYRKIRTRVQHEDHETINDFVIRESTIGQCTGLEDRNGNWIFEGDILAEGLCNTFAFIVRYGKYPENLTCKESHIGFYCDWISCHGLKPKCSLLFWAEKFEIVGNIYDNPELIN